MHVAVLDQLFRCVHACQIETESSIGDLSILCESDGFDPIGSDRNCRAGAGCRRAAIRRENDRRCSTLCRPANERLRITNPLGEVIRSEQVVELFEASAHEDIGWLFGRQSAAEDNIDAILEWTEFSRNALVGRAA